MDLPNELVRGICNVCYPSSTLGGTYASYIGNQVPAWNMKCEWGFWGSPKAWSQGMVRECFLWELLADGKALLRP